jgi:predicted GNAT family acetyltransferase
MGGKVTENAAMHRFELPIEDGEGAIAAAYYRLEDGALVLTHTEVPFEYSGQGFGSKLACGVFDILRATGRKAVLRCPFMSAFYSRHPEYSDVVVG